LDYRSRSGGGSGSLDGDEKERRQSFHAKETTSGTRSRRTASTARNVKPDLIFDSASLQAEFF